MTTISILPEMQPNAPPKFRAVVGEKHSLGASVGQALDALTAQLGESPTTLLVVVQPMQPDALFSAAQMQRFADLMERWRLARDSGTALPAEEQAELDTLVEAELRAATERSARLLRQVQP